MPKNWPEGLFIVLVMFGPVGVAFGLASSLGKFFLVLLLAMGCGLLLWAGTIFMFCRRSGASG
jgi:hypothetical protein